MYFLFLKFKIQKSFFLKSLTPHVVQRRTGSKKPPRYFGKSLTSKMYLKNLAILEKSPIPLKKSSKIMDIFIKAPHF
jgi:hypothetical protein